LPGLKVDYEPVEFNESKYKKEIFDKNGYDI